MTEALFDGPEPQVPQTAGERKRAQEQARIDAGRHPLTLLPLAGNGETCKTCVHRLRPRYHNKVWPKCDQTEITHGPATDCKASWPACERWEQR